MARKKQHPHIGKYVARYEFDVADDVGESNIDIVDTFDTPEAALASAMDDSHDDGDVIYVYAVVGVKRVSKPTLTENYIP